MKDSFGIVLLGVGFGRWLTVYSLFISEVKPFAQTNGKSSRFVFCLVTALVITVISLRRSRISVL